MTIGRRAVRLYPIYHHAAALYTPRMLETLREDFARIPELLAMGPPPQPEAEVADALAAARPAEAAEPQLPAAAEVSEPDQLDLF
jgi:DNA polymerase